MNNTRVRKCLATGIILLFVGTCIIPAIAQNTEKSQPSSKGNWLYVGGSGPGNYSKIQDAIDNASNGDTVFVFPGTYKERIVISQSITLQGADLHTTIIDGQGTNSDIVTCIARDSVITGFSIRNCSISYSCLIINHTSNCIVIGNVIHTGGYGVTLRNAQNISIINNSFFQILNGSSPPSIQRQTKAGYIGVKMDNCVFSTISKNRISSWDGGIFITGTHILITQNSISDTKQGITDSMNALPWINEYLTIKDNFLNNNRQGIHLFGSRYYSITHNQIKNSTNIGIYIAEDIYSGVNPENVTIEDNTITTSRYAIEADYGMNISIVGNQILHNDLGLLLQYNSRSSIKANIFQDNNRTVFYLSSVFPLVILQHKVPHFDNNYWNQAYSTPQPVFGRMNLFMPNMFFDSLNIFPWVTFDWHPAQEPYVIPGVK